MKKFEKRRSTATLILEEKQLEIRVSPKRVPDTVPKSPAPDGNQSTVVKLNEHRSRFVVSNPAQDKGVCRCLSVLCCLVYRQFSRNSRERERKNGINKGKGIIVTYWRCPLSDSLP
jgi:hypothetical protein